CFAGSPSACSRFPRSTRARGPTPLPGRSASRPPGSTSCRRARRRGSSSRGCTKGRVARCRSPLLPASSPCSCPDGANGHVAARGRARPRAPSPEGRRAPRGPHRGRPCPNGRRPGLLFAFTGESAYPVPAAFDHLDTRSDGRKWEWMWGWKDELAADKRLYYGKLLVKKPTFVSMKLLPIFYATFGRAGDADDHLEDVRAGRLSEIARRIIEF